MKTPRSTFTLLLVLFSLPVHAQGFGTLSKKKVTLHRKLPATVHLVGSGLRIQVSSRDAKNNDIAGQVADLLQIELLKYDKNLRVEPTHPDTLISASVTNFSMPPTEVVTRNVLTEKKVGKDLRQIEEPKRFYLIKGSLDLTYQAKDAHSGAILDSDIINTKYSQEFDAESGRSASSSAASRSWNAIKTPWKKVSGGKSSPEEPTAPTATELQQILARQAVTQVSARLVNTDEEIEVYLARGKFEEADKLAESGLWERMLESLEQMPPLPNKADDAYRLYNIGVAYEALGYRAEDAKAAKKFFDQAAINYGKALDAKPDEKYFLEPQNRIATALAHYRKLEQQPAMEASQHPSSEPTKEKPSVEKVDEQPTTRSASTTKARKSDKSPVSNTALKEKVNDGKAASDNTPPLTNEQVIKLFKAGMDEDNLISTINEAPVTNFDMSVEGQLELVKAGVKGKTLTAIRRKATSQKLHKPTAHSTAP